MDLVLYFLSSESSWTCDISLLETIISKHENENENDEFFSKLNILIPRTQTPTCLWAVEAQVRGTISLLSLLSKPTHLTVLDMFSRFFALCIYWPTSVIILVKENYSNLNTYKSSASLICSSASEKLIACSAVETRKRVQELLCLHVKLLYTAWLTYKLNCFWALSCPIIKTSCWWSALQDKHFFEQFTNISISNLITS